MMNKAETFKSGVINTIRRLEEQTPSLKSNPGLFLVVVPPGKDSENTNTHDTV